MLTENNVKYQIVAPGIHLYDDVFTSSDFLLKEIEEKMKNNLMNPWRQGTVITEEGQNIQEQYRKCLVADLPNFKGVKPTFYDKSELAKTLFNLHLPIYENIQPILEEYSKEYSASIEWSSDYQILKYGEGHYFTKHRDDCPEFHRRVSFSYYVNDNYKGGEIEFPYFNVSIKPKAHQLLIFPSAYIYSHIVKPVTSGTRYAIVCWMR